jgi:hypothetical protein
MMLLLARTLHLKVGASARCPPGNMRLLIGYLIDWANNLGPLMGGESLWRTFLNPEMLG